jgi:hypothetical protein
MEFPWLNTLQGAAAIDVAAQCGLLASLAEGRKDAPRSVLLETILIGVEVLEKMGDDIMLSPAFAEAWAADSAGIMARASFTRRAAADIAGGLEALVFDLPSFMEKSATFRLFRYDMAEGTGPENIAATRPWVAYVEALSRSESPHLVPILDVRDGDRILEIGGNTGILSTELISTYGGVSSTVYDLPAVCEIGREKRQIDGLNFVSGDARKPDALDRFSGAVDVVLFKSVLHDWPEQDAISMLLRAMKILSPGGRVIVCERDSFGAIDAAKNGTETLNNIVFSPFYREPDFYRSVLEENGFSVACKSAQLDMVFHATTGTCK